MIILSSICTLPYNFIGTNSRYPRIILFWTHLFEWIFIAVYAIIWIATYDNDGTKASVADVMIIVSMDAVWITCNVFIQLGLWKFYTEARDNDSQERNARIDAERATERNTNNFILILMD